MCCLATMCKESVDLLLLLRLLPAQHRVRELSNRLALALEQGSTLVKRPHSVRLRVILPVRPGLCWSIEPLDKAHPLQNRPHLGDELSVLLNGDIDLHSPASSTNEASAPVSVTQQTPLAPCLYGVAQTQGRAPNTLWRHRCYLESLLVQRVQKCPKM
jgi:hypothetical protein